MPQRTFVAVLAGIALSFLGAASVLAADIGGSLPPTVARSAGFPGSTGPSRQALEAARVRNQRLRESWRSPSSKAERKRLRRQYKNLSRKEARALAGQQHPSALLPKVWKPLRGVKRRGDYLDSYSARVTMPNGTKAVAVSRLPLRALDNSGKQRPVDLKLVAGSSGLRPKNPLVETVLPSRSSDPVRVGDIGFGLGGDTAVQLENDRAFYANAGGKDIDLIVMPTPSGVESFAQIRSIDAPQQVRIPFDLPAGTKLLSSSSAADAAIKVVRGKKTIATVSRPTAIDSQQRPVPVSYRVKGDALVMTVKHRSGDFAMPIMVDPTIAYGWNNDPRRLDAVGWGGYQSNPTSRWCSYFGDSYLGYGQYTYGRLQSNYPCASTSYAPYEIYEWNYYGEYSRGSTAFVEGWDEGYNFDIVSGNACHYSGIYSVGLGRWETYSGNECSDVWNNTRYHRASGTPRNYAVFGTVMNGGGPGQDFTNQLWGATVFVSDRENPITEQGSRRLPAGWTGDTTFDVRASDSGIGVDWTQIKVSTQGAGDYYDSQLHPCSADPANHCPAADTFPYSTTSMREGVSTVSAQAGDLIRHSGFGELGPIKIDRTPPRITAVSGTLKDADGRVTAEDGSRDGFVGLQQATLSVRAQDGDPSTPANQRSGVTSVVLKVDGQPVENGERTQTCARPEGSCDLPADFVLTRSFMTDLEDGEHSFSVTATDATGQTATEQRAMA